MHDLENRSKCNNIVIWGVKEESQKTFNSMVEFLETEFFKNHMGLDDGENSQNAWPQVSLRTTITKTCQFLFQVTS